MRKKYIFLLVFCVLFFAYQYGLRTAIPNVLNGELQDYFGANTSQIGFLVSLSCLAYTVMQIPVGLVTDRISIKKIAVSSFFSFSLGLIVFVSSSNFVCASIIQVFLGASSSFALVMVMKIANNYFPQEKIALISGLAVSAGGVGPIICNPLMAHLVTNFSWINVVACFGVLGLLISLIGFFAIKEKDLIDSDVEVISSSIRQDIKAIVFDRRYIGISVFSMATWGACSSFCDAWGVSFMTCVHEISREEAAFAVGFAYTGMIFGGPLSAYLSKIFNSFKKAMLVEAIGVALLLSLVGFVKLSFISLCVSLFAVGVLAMCQFLAFPVALSLGEKRLGATITGVVNTIIMSGCTILIWAFGYVLDWSKGSNLTYGATDYRCGIMASLISVLFAIIVLAFIKLPAYKDVSEKKS
ncbi:MAG: MFS transporter [Alphaproteobacteria bacterium]|nr:MFS transporter [Alphaproteobacteria bacterium]MBO7537028.1 MFS transporter [Alphaproteobacteria bacterium]MBO7642090.1 MFS transporter [Alphaproteobacteria bacterium]